MYEKQSQEIGMMIIEEAADRFTECGAASDFCIQHIGAAVIFGGTNRLIFSLKVGFYLDKSYCTERFIKEYEARYNHERKDNHVN